MSIRSLTAAAPPPVQTSCAQCTTTSSGSAAGRAIPPLLIWRIFFASAPRFYLKNGFTDCGRALFMAKEMGRGE